MVISSAAAALGSAGLGMIGNIVGGLSSNALSVFKQKQILEHQAALNYKYAKKSALNSPTWNKVGLVNAGLNPMLALGNQNSPTTGWTSGGDGSVSDFSNIGSNAVSNALSVRQQENQDALSSAQVENYNADSTLKSFQTITELYNQLEKANHADYLHAQAVLTRKDIDAYDKKLALYQKQVANEIERTGNELKIGMANALTQQIIAQVQGYNAVTGRIDAKTNQTNADTAKERLKFDKKKYYFNSGLLGVGSLLIPGYGYLKGAKAAKNVFNALHFIGK